MASLIGLNRSGGIVGLTVRSNNLPTLQYPQPIIRLQL